MAKVKIPINTGSNKAIDEVGLGQLGAELRDAYVDDLGSVVKRYGLAHFTNTHFQVAGVNVPVDGLFWWDKVGVLVAVGGSKVYTVDDSGAMALRISGLSSVQQGQRVSFAAMDNGGTATLFMANGSKIFYMTEGFAGGEITDADAPQNVSKIATMDDYLLAIDDDEDQVFAWSNPGSPLVWDASDFASAELQDDQLVNIGVAHSRIYLAGKRTIEVWKNDGVSPFVREFQGFVERGVIAPDSFVLGNGVWFWLDNYRQVVALTSNGLEVLSTSLNKQIQDYQSVSDAIGNFVVIAGRPYYLLTFPTEGETLVYDINAKLWYEWGTWNGTDYDEWIGARQIVLAEAWNKVIVGTADGLLVEARLDAYTDFDSTKVDVTGVTLSGNDPVVVSYSISSGYSNRIYAGDSVRFEGVNGTTELNGNTYTVTDATSSQMTLGGTDSSQFSAWTSGGTATGGGMIRTLVRTGHLDHGSNSVRKRVRSLTLRLKRSNVANDTLINASIDVRWRDNGSSSWQAAKTVPLTSISDTDYRAQLWQLGIYYSRQYEFVISSSQPLILVYAEEDVEALDA